MRRMKYVHTQHWNIFVKLIIKSFWNKGLERLNHDNFLTNFIKCYRNKQNSLFSDDTGFENILKHHLMLNWCMQSCQIILHNQHP